MGSSMFARAKFKPASRHQQGGWLSFLTGLALGLFVALLVYLRSQSSPNNTLAPSNNEQLPEETGTSASAPAAKPSFDFYTILPEMEMKVPEWKIDEAPPSPPPETFANAGGSYMLQVGSFQRPEEADRVKARLALIGVTANIQKVTTSTQDIWYRVRVGPFKDLAALQATRARLTENNISFVLMRVKS